MNTATKNLLYDLFYRISQIRVGDSFTFSNTDDEKVTIEAFGESLDYYGDRLDCWTFVLTLSYEDLVNPDADLNALLNKQYNKLYAQRMETQERERKAKHEEMLARQAAGERAEYYRLKEKFEAHR